MATILSLTLSQYDIPVTPFPNFIEQASTCKRLVYALGETVTQPGVRPSAVNLTPA